MCSMICDIGGLHETLSSEFISDWYWSVDEIDDDNDDDDDDDKDNPIIAWMRAYTHTHTHISVHSYIRVRSYIRTYRHIYILCSIF